MEPYKIRVKETVAVVDRPIPYYITKGAVGVPVKAKFSSDWDGLAITMVVKGSGKVIDILVEPEDHIIEATLPQECLATAWDRLYVGFYGTDGENVVIPTIWADMGFIYDAADPSGDPSADPTIPLYSQLQAQVEALAREIEQKTIFWQRWVIDG